MNIVILQGNLTRDPELRFTPKNDPICEVGIAVNKKWKGPDGTPRESVYFGELQIWGPRGEAFSKYHKKGSPCLIRGELTLDEWTDKTSNEKRTKTRIKVEDWSFVGAKQDKDSGDAPAAAPRQQQTPREYQLKRPAPAPAQQQPMHEVTQDELENMDSIPF